MPAATKAKKAPSKPRPDKRPLLAKTVQDLDRESGGPRVHHGERLALSLLVFPQQALTQSRLLQALQDHQWAKARRLLERGASVHPADHGGVGIIRWLVDAVTHAAPGYYHTHAGHQVRHIAPVLEAALARATGPEDLTSQHAQPNPLLTTLLRAPNDDAIHELVETGIIQEWRQEPFDERDRWPSQPIAKWIERLLVLGADPQEGRPSSEGNPSSPLATLIDTACGWWRLEQRRRWWQALRQHGARMDGHLTGYGRCTQTTSFVDSYDRLVDATPLHWILAHGFGRAQDIPDSPAHMMNWTHSWLMLEEALHDTEALVTRARCYAPVKRLHYKEPPLIEQDEPYAALTPLEYLVHRQTSYVPGEYTQLLARLIQATERAQAERLGAFGAPAGRGDRVRL